MDGPRMRGRSSASSFNKPRSIASSGSNIGSNYSSTGNNYSSTGSSIGISVGSTSAGVLCPPAPITPTSTSASPPATLMHFADFFVDPSAVSPAEAVSLAEEMAADFYSEVSIMYDMLSDIKTPTAEGRAVDELMRRMHNLLGAADGLAARGGNNLATQISNVRGLYNGLIRVFIFLYQRYYRAFVVLEVSELLAASWQRLLAFVMEYRILDEVFVRKVYDHVAQIVSSV
ncbi:hypothetical protein PHYSODRAFT_312000 [Phytophthora sojae]|uniref:Uncharacterized protein n=1 Tax=Phytophthora sojae (strain P6497) TaxID=1094619 RepID=G4YX51_PHYSP|nr:hypothetical protein PHYSODRAFT_312000 [Phytophthora sojae]EGZ25619.1 hypothetical protein PHYSODRAFT_312000 [Phytophthora sojae]|eukprot:XP_009520907.1 hypothetical protein PHYSODRAFT_312000 [Phytophthora sojae]